MLGSARAARGLGKQTGQRAARLLIRLLDGEINSVHVRIPVPALVRGQECITATGIYGNWVKRTGGV